MAKRIDVYTTALFHGMKVEALNDLDLSYTPPLGSPWDAVQMGGAGLEPRGGIDTYKQGKLLMEKKRVLILCTGNSARSQMAEGLLRHDAGDVFEVESAGTKPGTVRPEVIASMREIGIDITGHRSKHVDEFEGQRFDYVITVCDNAKESCPVFIGATKLLHHSFDDPPKPSVGTDDERMESFRRVRDELRTYLVEFARQTQDKEV